MKPLDRQAELVFRKVTEGLDTVGDCRKIDGSINVEMIELTKLGRSFRLRDFATALTTLRPETSASSFSFRALEPSQGISCKTPTNASIQSPTDTTT